MAGGPRRPVAAGVGGYADRSWFGHEGVGLPTGPEVALDARHAVDVLLDLSRDPDPPVVAAVGMQSNVAAAVARDVEYALRVPLLAVMGGIFGPVVRYGVPIEDGDHNLACDPGASAASLNAGFSILYVPLDVTVRVVLRTHISPPSFLVRRISLTTDSPECSRARRSRMPASSSGCATDRICGRFCRSARL